MNVTSHVDMNTVEGLRMQTTQGNNLEAPNLSGLAGNMLRTDMNSARILNIPNGFDQERLRIFVHVTSASQMGSNFNYYYSGFTDHVGIDDQGNFNPNMQIFLNGCIMVSSTYRNTPNGLQPIHVVNDVSHLLNPNTMGANYQTQFDANLQPSNSPSTLRPYDVFSNNACQESQTQSGIPVLNFATTVSPKSMNRLNYIPQNYLSTSLKAMRFASDQTQFDTTVDKYNSMQSMVTERQITSDQFINDLNQAQFLTNGWVTFGQLANIHPEIKDGTRVAYAAQGAVIKDQSQNMYVPRVGQYENFANSNGINKSTEAMIAQTLLSTLPGILLTNLLRKCRIIVTNMSPNQPGLIVRCDSPEPIAEMPTEVVASRIGVLESIMTKAVFNYLPINVHAPILMTIMSDLFGTTFMSISYNGQPEVKFAVPSFADSMASPLVAQSKQPLDQMTNDFSFLEESVQL